MINILIYYDMTYSIIISNNSSLFSKSCDKQPCNDEWIVVIIRENYFALFLYKRRHRPL